MQTTTTTTCWNCRWFTDIVLQKWIGCGHASNPGNPYKRSLESIHTHVIPQISSLHPLQKPTAAQNRLALMCRVTSLLARLSPVNNVHVLYARGHPRFFLGFPRKYIQFAAVANCPYPGTLQIAFIFPHHHHHHPGCDSLILHRPPTTNSVITCRWCGPFAWNSLFAVEFSRFLERIV